MLRLTRTAIGLLTAQYRSVLKKCWAINVGVFALGAIAATVPTTALVGTLSLGINMVSTTNANAHGYVYVDTTINDSSDHYNESYTPGTDPNRSQSGGVYYVNGGNLTVSGTYAGNYVEKSTYGNAGAIGVGDWNGYLTVDGATFDGNYIVATGRGTGGAIWNQVGTTLIINNSSFIGNYVASNSGIALGGALATNAVSNSIQDSTFTNNYVSGNSSSKGGAIYIDSDASINFSGTNTFSNNKANGSLNDIYNGGTVNVASGTTTLNSGYIGDSSATFNVNNGGTLEMGSSAAFSGGALNINYGGTAEMIDSKLQASTINNDGTLNLTMDGTSYTARTITNNGTLNVIHPNTRGDWYFRHNIDNSGGGTVVFDNQYTSNYWLQLKDKSITGGTVEINPTRGSGYSDNYVYLRDGNTWDIDNLIVDGALRLSSSDKITTDALTNIGSGIYNDGTFTLEGSGNNSLDRFTGSGTLNITNTGYTTAYSTIENNIFIESGADVYGAFSNFGGSITNNGWFETYGIINKQISGSGNVSLVGNTTLSGNYLSGQSLNTNGYKLTMNSTTRRYVAQLSGGGNLGVYLNGSSASNIYSSTSYNSGTYTITSISGTTPTTNQSYTILSAKGTTLDLSTAIKNATYSATKTTYGSDSIASTTPWTQGYYQNWSRNDTVYGKYSVSNNTTYKYLNYTVTSTSTGTKTNTGSMGDTLYLVNTASGTRNFNASSATSTYTSSATPGATYGTTNINGVVNGSNRSALNLGGYAGFSLDGSDIVNLSNMRLYGANSYTANLASANSKLTLNNTVLDGAQVYGSGMVELTGTNTVNAPLNNTGTTTVVNGTTDFNSTVAGFTNNGTVNVDASNITDEVTNNGTLNLSSGTLNYALTNTDTVNNSATINATITNSETGTFDNDGILAGNVDNSGTLDNNGTLSGTVTNSGTLKTAANTLTGSSVTNNGILELEGGNLTTSLNSVGNGRGIMKLMSGGIRLLATTPPTTTGSLYFGDSDDYVDSIATTIRDTSSASSTAIATEAAVAAALATAGGGSTYTAGTGIKIENDEISIAPEFSNNYYTKNTKRQILDGATEGKNKKNI